MMLLVLTCEKKIATVPNKLATILNAIAHPRPTGPGPQRLKLGHGATDALGHTEETPNSLRNRKNPQIRGKQNKKLTAIRVGEPPAGVS